MVLARSARRKNLATVYSNARRSASARERGVGDGGTLLKEVEPVLDLPSFSGENSEPGRDSKESLTSQQQSNGGHCQSKTA